MRKLRIEDTDLMRIAIQQEIGRSEESRYDHRLHGLLLVMAGQSCRQVADWFGACLSGCHTQSLDVAC
ncbi:hypothetical protein B1B_00114 [mine drainage metagenome]|uniref:Uncharacterized protein n=1 Tax=mine drainage metagenome TaxID=410659 RepID=T1DE25_9ZZZZ